MPSFHLYLILLVVCWNEASHGHFSWDLLIVKCTNISSHIFNDHWIWSVHPLKYIIFCGRRGNSYMFLKYGGAAGSSFVVLLFYHFDSRRLRKGLSVPVRFHLLYEGMNYEICYIIQFCLKQIFIVPCFFPFELI